MTDFYIGQVCFFAFQRPPAGWLPCDGRLLPIMQYQALFSLLGTAYGGDGRTNFALPDLRGRVPVTPANGATGRLSTNRLGDAGGATSITIPSGSGVSAAKPEGSSQTETVQTPQTISTALPPPPYVTLNAFICLDGMYPVPE
ncbi:phage tail protein [Niveispirillum irakense]|uniref:phage tail protein n=1 Tax=Niveispirillum irakense TaxID=34011 RepID=UPI0003F5A4AF|nr:tail fiber protein [Niveispirillum irakense]